mmetsp:Transcript_23776/g.58286  ORF Transcript_23776/g.58286 Transcript_23776/m.58286 type:complete len:292 (+) Transcript_23776:943-1818(+)
MGPPAAALKGVFAGVLGAEGLAGVAVVLVVLAAPSTPSAPASDSAPPSAAVGGGSGTNVASAASIASWLAAAASVHSSSSSSSAPPPPPPLPPSFPLRRITVSSPSTRSASRCARRLMAATSSLTFQVRGSPLESLLNTRANAVFIAASAPTAESRALLSTTSRTRRDIAAPCFTVSVSASSNPASASESCAQCFLAEDASRALRRSQRSAGASSSRPMTAAPTPRSMARSAVCVASARRSLRSALTAAVASFSNAAVASAATELQVTIPATAAFAASPAAFAASNALGDL